MKKQYFYMCIFLMAFCSICSFTKAQDVGNEDENGSGGYVIMPDGTVVNNYGVPGNGGAWVYNTDGTNAWIPGAIVMPGTAPGATTSGTTTSGNTWSISTNGTGIIQNSDNSYTLILPIDGGSVDITFDQTTIYSVSTDLGTCDNCTEQQAMADIPIDMPTPMLPPNPTQAEINTLTATMQLYGAAMNAYYAPCPTGQYKDSCGHCITNGQTSTCTKDCSGQWGGKAFKDSCGHCAGGNTGLPACVAPTKVNCDPIGVKLDTTATKILNNINPSPQMTQLRDSTSGTHEVSLSSYDSSGTSRVLPNSFSIGNNGNTHIVPIDTTKGPNHKNVNAIVHLHEVGMDPLPDCADVYNILNGRVYPNTKNIFLNNSIIVCGDTLIDLAISISDTTAALAFINLYRQDSAIHFDSTGNNPEWSNTYKGFLGTDSLSMGQEFNKAVQQLALANYPAELQWTFAQVYMMSRYNMGARILMKVNGVFKSMTPAISRDAKGNLTGLKINICN